MRVLLVLLVLFVLSAHDLCGIDYTWPVLETDARWPQPSVVLAYGNAEEHGQARKFHEAIDVPTNCAGPYPYPVWCGVVLAVCDAEYVDYYNDIYYEGWSLVIRETGATSPKYWRYDHVAGYFHGSPAQFDRGDWICHIFNGTWNHNMADHIHFRLVDDFSYYNSIGNPLLNMGDDLQDPGGTPPFIWVSDPDAHRLGFRVQEDANWGPSEKVRWIYREEAEEPVERISGDVDIIAKAQDDMRGILMDGTTPVYTGVLKLGFWVVGPSEESSIGSAEEPIISYVCFEDAVPYYKAFYRYYSKYGNSFDNFYYLVTNLDGERDSCWATSAKAGQSGLNKGNQKTNKARFAKFPDGTYNVYVRAWDAENQGSGAHPAKVILDNFNPIVLSSDPPAEDLVVDPDIDVVAYFSEELDESTVQSSFSLRNETTSEVVQGILTYNSIDHSMVFDPILPLSNGTYEATITDAVKDLSGNKLDGDEDGNEGGDCVWRFGVAGPEVYIVDTGNSRIQVFDVRGTYLWEFGAFILNPAYTTVTVDAVSQPGVDIKFVYLTEHSDYLIKKFSSEGTFITQSDPFGTQLRGITSGPTHIYTVGGVSGSVWTLNSDLIVEGFWGLLYSNPQGINYNLATDRLFIPHLTSPRRLTRYTTLGFLEREIVLEGASSFISPASDDNSVYVPVFLPAFNRHHIFVYDLWLSEQTSDIGDYDQQMLGIAVDDKRIYFSQVNDYVTVLDKETHEFLYEFGGPGSGPGEFIDPCGIAIYVPTDEGSQLAAGSRSQAPGGSPHLQMGRELKSMPHVFGLSQNFPNPFHHTTRISYQLPARSCVTLGIYNTAGQVVNILVDQDKDPGYYSVEWDGKDALGRKVPSGAYLSHVKAGEFTETRKLILVR